ncbi:MAG: hypothetical protein AB1578_18090 [Thermodesulfobacteriota bacterium]
MKTSGYTRGAFLGAGAAALAAVRAVRANSAPCPVTPPNVEGPFSFAGDPHLPGDPFALPFLVIPLAAAFAGGFEGVFDVVLERA